MGGGNQIIIGQPLQHVTYVDHYFVLTRYDVFPFTFLIEQLQASGGSPHQKGNQIDVLVLFCPNRSRRLLCDGRIVDGAKNAIAFVYLWVKIMLSQFEMDGNSS